MGEVYLSAAKQHQGKQQHQMQCLFSYHQKKKFTLSKTHQRFRSHIRFGSNFLLDQLGLQKGYLFRDRVVRPSMVTFGRVMSGSAEATWIVNAPVAGSYPGSGLLGMLKAMVTG